MTAIYRVDGNSVVTSPDAAGPWDRRMQHGSAPASLVTWAAERIPTPVAMDIARVTIDLMRPVPVAPLTIATEVLREGRKIQLCEVKLLGRWRAGRRCDRAQDQAPGAYAARRRQGAAALRCRRLRIHWSRTATPPPARSCDQSRCAPRAPLWPGRRRRDLVSRRPSPDRGRSRLAGDARRGGRRLLHRHRLDAGFPRLDLHQRRSHGELCAPAGRRMDSARRRDPGSAPTAPGLRCRGSRTDKAISVERCRVS